MKKNMDKMILLLFTITAILPNYAVGACTFAPNLQGIWNGGVDAETNKEMIFRFDDDMLKGFALKLNTAMITKNFRCYDEETSGGVTRYILKATEPLPIFNIKVDLYVCLGINGHHQYAVETGLNQLFGDKVYAYPVGIELPRDKICNRKDASMITMTKSADQLGREENRDVERLLERLEKNLEG